MIAKNHSKNLFVNLSRLKNIKENKSCIFTINKNNFVYKYLKFSTKNAKNENNLNKEIKSYSDFAEINKINKNNKNIHKINNRNFGTKETIEPNTNSKINLDEINKVNLSINSNLYIDEYLQPAINIILSELNKDLKNKDLEIFLKENKSFEKLYKVFMEILKKGEDNLFPYLTLIFDLNKNKNNQTQIPNKINIILTENFLNLKKKYICLAISNQLLNDLKKQEKTKAENNLDFESSFKNKIFGGGLYESIISQNDNSKTKDFKGALIITKNFKDAIDYYENFRKFDKECKLKIKKFGSVHLGIKGFSLKKEKSLINDFLTTAQEDKKNDKLPE